MYLANSCRTNQATTHPARNQPPSQLVLPLPNVTIYYSVWRIWSHRSAGGGSRALLAALEASSDVQRYELALRLQRLQAQGVEFKQGEWPERMVADIDR